MSFIIKNWNVGFKYVILYASGNFYLLPIYILGENVMGLFDVSEEKKRAKEIRKEGKELRKKLVTAGMEKRTADQFLEEYIACLETACLERDAYKNARIHMKTCMDKIDNILLDMREIAPEVCKTKLQGLLEDLSLVYHHCLVRQDDMDFASTYVYMKKQIPAYKAEDRLMMQSELENLKAVFADEVQWNPPEYMSLAYFLRHERKELLADMENSQRNNHMEIIYNEQFWDKYAPLIEQIDMLDEVLQLEKRYLHNASYLIINEMIRREG